MSHIILLNTLFTLFTTFWCCIRPDFPSPHDSKLRILSAKLNIIFWVLILPEGVFYWSMTQWCEAGNITEHFFQDYGWTRQHSLFLLMGGFILGDKDGRPVKTLSLQHFFTLLEEKVIDFPILTSFEIQEHSRLHLVFALFAFLQGTWFLAKCVSRLTSSSPASQGFPVITQLEAITASLVIASCCIFFSSWKKPLDPRFPILLKPKSQASSLYTRDGIGHRRISNFQREQSQAHMTERRFQFERPQPASRSVLQVRPGLIVSLAIWPLQSILNDLTQLVYVRYYADIPEFPDGTLKIPLFYVDNTMSPLTPLLPAAMLGMGTSIVSLLFILRSDSSSFYFSSPAVHLIWRVASITTTSINAFTLFLLVLVKIFGSLVSHCRFRTHTSMWIHHLAFVCFAIFNFIAVAGLAPFLLARVSLLVASLLCVKSVPGDAFVGQRSWVDYIPHL